MHLVLAVEPHGVADRGQQCLSHCQMRLAGGGIADQRADPAPDCRGRVRHGPDDRGAGAEHRLEGGNRRARRDREEDRAVTGQAGQLRRGLGHHLGLDRDDSDGGGGEPCRVQGDALGHPLGQPIRGMGLDHLHLIGRQAAGEPTLQHRAAHLAATEQHQ